MPRAPNPRSRPHPVHLLSMTLKGVSCPTQSPQPLSTAGFFAVNPSGVGRFAALTASPPVLWAGEVGRGGLCDLSTGREQLRMEDGAVFAGGAGALAARALRSRDRVAASEFGLTERCVPR